MVYSLIKQTVKEKEKLEKKKGRLKIDESKHFSFVSILKLIKSSFWGFWYQSLLFVYLCYQSSPGNFFYLKNV